jgi:hypothetical protein
VIPAPLRSRAAAATLVLLVMLGCSDLHVPEPGATVQVRVTPDTVVLRTGDSALVIASPVDSTSTLLAQKTVAWSSGSPAVVTVDEDGLVKAVGPGTATITAAVDGIQGQATIVVTGAPALAAVHVGNNQSAAVNAAVPVAPAVKVTDAGGNPVPLAAVVFAVATGGGTVVAGAEVLTGFDGVASATSWTLGPFTGANTLTATVTGTGITGNPVTFTATGTVGAPSAAQSTVDASPSAIPPSNGSSLSTITVTVKDANGSTISGALVTIAVSGSGNTVFQPTDTTNGAGQATGAFSSNVAETKTVTATVNAAVVITQTATVTVSTATATGLGIFTQPAGAAGNAAFTTQPVVDIRDGFGNRVPTATNAVTATLVAGDGTLLGTTTVNAVAGRATFTNLLIRGPRVGGDTLGTGPHAIQFAATGFTAVRSDTFQVAVSFGYNVADIFTRSCNACHGFNYGNVVNAATSLSCAGNTRVVASDTTNSFLYAKIKTSTPSCGAVMPTSGLMSLHQIRMIRDWIVQGAPNN